MTEQTKRAAIYARVSSEQQRKNSSIEIQLRTCREYATRAGFTVAPEHEFVDAFTGTKLDRPGFDEAKDVVGKVDAVIFHVQDRFGRADALDTVQQIRWFEQHGTRVHITNRGEIDTTDDIGLIILILEVQAAKKERDSIIRRTSDGMYDRAKKGKVCPGRTPYYGYDYKDGQFVLNPAEAPWLLKIYKWHGIERLGLTAIADRLQELEVPTKWDNLGLTKPSAPRCRWHDSTLSNIIKSCIYKGIWVYGKTNKNGRPHESVSVPAIVSPDLWDAAQQVSKENRKNNKGGQKYPALFYGRMTCSCCNRPFVQNHDNRSDSRTYKCYGQRKRCSPDGKHQLCVGSFNLAGLDDAVWHGIAEALKHPERIEEGLRQRKVEDEAKLQPDREYLARLQSELKKLDDRWQRLKNWYLDGSCPKEDFDRDKALIDYERQLKRDKIAELEERLSVPVVDDESIKAFRSYCTRIRRNIDSLTDEEKRRVIEVLNIRPTLHRGNPVKNGRKCRGSGTITLTAIVPLDVEIPLNSDACNLSHNAYTVPILDLTR